MSILDMAKSFLGENSQLMGFATGLHSFMDENGGFEGLKAKFEKGGASDTLQSWVSKGANMPISADQVQKILGNETVQNLATKMGIDPKTASEKLAEYLPKLVDLATPHGSAEGGLNLASVTGAAPESTH